MFVLRANNIDFDEIIITSKSRDSLEEMLLSIYEEDMYDWFCIYNDVKPAYIKYKDILAQAKEKAKEDIDDNYIIEKVMIMD